MKFKLLIILYLGLFQQSLISQSRDSITLIDLSNKIQKLEESNKELVFKLDVYNEANNKLLEPSYALLALIFGIGIWNAIKNYRFDNQRLKLIEETIFKNVQDKNNEAIRVLTDSINRRIENSLKLVKSQILEIQIFQEKLKCESIEVREYRDINIELFKLHSLLELSHELFITTGNDKELKDALKYVLSYFKKYPYKVGYEEYETDLVRNKVKSINLESVSEICSLILDLSRKK